MTGSRDINASTITASSAPVIHPIVFVKLEFDGGDVNLHSELGEIAFGGDTYTGTGKLGSISAAEEVSDLSHSQIKLGLSGLPLDIVSIVFNEQYQGRLATVYLGYLDRVTRTLVDTPTILYKGLIDTADIEQGQTFAVTISVGNRFAAWDKPKVRRYNDSDQQSRYPGDLGLQMIERSAYKTVIWGGAK